MPQGQWPRPGVWEGCVLIGTSWPPTSAYSTPSTSAIHFQTGPSEMPSGTTISSLISPVAASTACTSVIGQVQQLRRGDHRVAVDHEAFGQRPLPEDRAVVAVGADQRIEHRVLVGLVGDVPERAKHTSAGRHGDLRHGDEQRLGQELRQVRGAGQLVLGLRVVVRTVVGMAPRVDAGGKRFDDFLVAEQRFALGMQDAEQLAAAALLGRGRRDQHGAGDVVGQVQSACVTRVCKHPAAQQAGGLRRLAHRLDLVRLRRLEVHHQFAAAGQLGHRFRRAAFRQTHDGANPSRHTQAGQSRLGCGRHVRLIRSRSRGDPRQVNPDRQEKPSYSRHDCILRSK